MQKYIVFIGFILCATVALRAQFSATGGANGNPCNVVPATGSGLDSVFVFDGFENAVLTFSTENPSACKWYRYAKDASDATLVSALDVQNAIGQTVLTNITEEGGYLVETGTGLKRYVYLLNYVPVDFGSFDPCLTCDACNIMQASFPSYKAAEMNYYSVTGSKISVKRSYILSWTTLEWDASGKTYTHKAASSTVQNSPSWIIDAPLADTYFTVGDYFGTRFGKTVQTDLYKAVSVKTNADAEMLARTAGNELDKVSVSGDLSGSAPLNVQFYSHPSEAVQSFAWKVYDSVSDTGKVVRYTSEEDLLHTFREAGSFLVKVIVSSSNDVCQDSAMFTVKVSDSYIECPNFFTPRSSPGENDEFKVAYRSIVSFKGTIVNRWGNVMFEWNDPALGWNGTYKGKAVSPGVYFYLIEAKGADGTVYKKKGDINLLE